MTDQWVPGPPPKPPTWVNPLPPSNEWADAEGCSAVNGPSIVDGIVITGTPATVSSLHWQVSLNDGSAPPNFQINQLDGQGTLLDTAVQISGVDLSASFAGPVYLARDPVEPMEAVTLEYLEAHGAGVPEVPDNQTYGRTEGAWNLVVPAAGGTFTGQTNLAAGGAVTSGALLFAGSAVCSVPTVAQLQIGGGSSGQVPATDGNGNLSWITPVTGGPYLPIAGGTVTGSLTVNQVLTVQGANSFVLNAPNGQQRAILGQTSTLTRWQLMLGDGTSEGLGNTGSNFSLTAYATAGGFLGNWLTIARADGATVFNGSGVTIQGGLAVNGLLALAGPGNLAIYGGSAGQVLSTNGSGILSWTTPAGGGGGIADAPNDGTLYGRKSAAWSHLTHNDIADWTTTLAPYALTANIPIASSTPPQMDGSVAVGTGTTWARADHVHPSDTSRYAASNPSGYQTAAQVAAATALSLPLAGGTLTGPLNGTAATFSGALGAANGTITNDLTINGNGVKYNLAGLAGPGHDVAFGWQAANTGGPTGVSNGALQVAVDGATGGSPGYVVRTTWVSGTTAPVNLISSNSAASVLTASLNGSVSVTWSVTSSDVRLKSDLAPAADALSVVNAVPVYSCTFNPQPEDAPSEYWDYTLVADQVREHLPFAYMAPPEGGYASLHPLHLIATLWRAVQQLNERIAELERTSQLPSQT